MKHNDERNPYRRKSKTEMETNGRNECDLESPYRETERLPGWLHEYSHRSGRRRTEESRIKREGMAENALLERAVNLILQNEKTEKVLVEEILESAGTECFTKFDDGTYAWKGL